MKTRAILLLLIAGLTLGVSDPEVCETSLQNQDQEISTSLELFRKHEERKASDNRAYLKRNYSRDTSRFRNLLRRSRRQGNKSSMKHHGRRTEKVALLIHGLSDSPHFMRFYQETLYSMGLNTVSIALSGHGLENQALADAKLSNLRNWRRDIKEGFEIAQSLGDQVVGVGFSAGGALLMDALTREMKMDFLILVAPALQIKDKRVQTVGSTGLKLLSFLEWPGRHWDQNNFEFRYDRIAKNGIFQLQRLIEELNTFRSWQKVSRPKLLSLSSEADATVDSDYALNFLRGIGLCQGGHVFTFTSCENVSHIEVTGCESDGAPAACWQSRKLEIRDRMSEFLEGRR